MNICNKDINLLLVFHVLYQERNASQAAARMAGFDLERTREFDCDYFRVSVEDNGPGIPDNFKEKVFNRMLRGDSKADAALRFHDTLAAVTADICGKIRRESGVERVVLSGGVFQNKLLSERIYALLQERNFQVYTHRLVPPNDGGLALGQAVIAGRATCDTNR